MKQYRVLVTANKEKWFFLSGVSHENKDDAIFEGETCGKFHDHVTVEDYKIQEREVNEWRDCEKS